MATGDEPDPGFRQIEIIGSMEDQALTGTVCFSRQAAVIGYIGNEPGDVRVHPKGSGQENPPVFRDSGVPVHQEIQDRFTRDFRVTALDELTQLHLVPEQHDVFGTHAHGNQVG